MNSSVDVSFSIAQSSIIAADLNAVRQQVPLVLNLTNLVVMQTTANALLAVGASPIMSNAREELEDLLQLASSLVINIGTLNPETIDMMQYAMQLAGQKSIPMVVDPVGAGASQLRTQAAHKLCRLKPAVIRGNASEIMALAGESQTSKGVDSANTSGQAIIAAKELTQRYQAVIVISGARDIIISDNNITYLDNGHPLMTRITGTGCTATALIGAFCAVQPDFYQAAISAMTVTTIAGEIAAEKSPAPGSWAIHFLDALYQLDAAKITQRLHLTHA